MNNRSMMAIEAFALCGMTCERIDAVLETVPGYAHNVVTAWWLDQKMGKSHEAVRRWVREVKAFAASRSEMAALDKKGMGTTWAWAMAQGALRYLPDEVATDIRIERVGDRVMARKVAHDGQ